MDEDGNAFDLEEVLTPIEDDDTKGGKMELKLLADYIAEELREWS